MEEKNHGEFMIHERLKYEQGKKQQRKISEKKCECVPEGFLNESLRNFVMDRKKVCYENLWVKIEI